MKRIILIMTTALFYLSASAQQNVITRGTSLEYLVAPHGRMMSSTLYIEKLREDTITISWVLYDRSGRRSMLRNSIEKSKYGYWAPPFDDEDIIVPEDQSMLIISKSSFKELKEKGQTEFDGQLFSMRDNRNTFAYPVNGKTITAIRADSENNSSHIWILDDPTFPLIIKYQGNPYDVDVELTSIN